MDDPTYLLGLHEDMRRTCFFWGFLMPRHVDHKKRERSAEYEKRKKQYKIDREILREKKTAVKLKRCHKIRTSEGRLCHHACVDGMTKDDPQCIALLKGEKWCPNFYWVHREFAAAWFRGDYNQ